jgi:hypothetical protein
MTHFLISFPCEAALEWARKVAASCRSPQQVRAFQHDPLS